MKYSFIIPCYNATEKDFRRCLDYIKNQTFKDYEVICVDDCSPVDTPKIAKEYGFKYIRHEVNKQNGGARNTGIREAKGEYLVFCNSDDYFETNTLEEIEKVNKGQDLILLGFKCFGASVFGYTPKKEDGFNVSKFTWFGEPMHVVNRKFILKNNLFEIENKLVVDVDWTLRLEKCVKTWDIVPKMLYNFQTGGENSLTSRIQRGELQNDILEMLGTDNIEVTLYIHSLQEVGGDATFVYNLTKRLSKFYNITILYMEDSNVERIYELSKYAKIKKYDDTLHICDCFISNSTWGKEPNVLTKKYFLVIHADYEENYKLYDFKYVPSTNKQIEYIAVSELARQKFLKMYNIDSKVIYNLLDNEVKIDKVLKFITLSRITKEKGFEELLQIAKKLKEKNKKFLWFIFGDLKTPYAQDIINRAKDIPELIFMPARLDTASYIKICDYCWHPSHTESWGYAPYEALQQNVPCIISNYPVAKEMIEDGVNGYIVPDNVDWDKFIDKIYETIPKFEFKELGSEQDWIKTIGKPKGKLVKVKPIKKKIYVPEPIGEVEVIMKFKDDNNKQINVGDTDYVISEERKLILLNYGILRRKIV